MFGQYTIADTQKIARTPKIPDISSCALPLCRSCLNEKGGRSSLNTSTSIPNPAHTDVVKNGYLLPGNCVSTDQYECRVKGRLPNTKEKEDPQKMLCGGTFFVDHASGLIIIYNQVSLGTSDNIRSKEQYEMKACEFGITVKIYRGDNSVYKTKYFVEVLKTRRSTWPEWCSRESHINSCKVG